GRNLPFAAPFANLRLTIGSETTLTSKWHPEQSFRSQVMRNAKLLMGVVAPALAIIAPAGAAAPGVDASVQLSIGVVGFVPVVCRASLETNAVAPRVGTANLGKLNE